MRSTDPLGLDDENVRVRPYGYVADEVVCERLGDREAYVGNEHAADSARNDRSFEYVLSATSDPKSMTTHHCPLVDGPDNDYRAFADAVDVTGDLLGRDGSTLVHCKVGVSRSPALLATAVAVAERRSLRDALRVVDDARPIAMPHPAVLETAVTYLAARDHRYVE